ncbi:MAG: prenyltransferase/squalene oxidase repeat-containing protein [Acutalibacteraceae bacterium]
MKLIKRFVCVIMCFLTVLSGFVTAQASQLDLNIIISDCINWRKLKNGDNINDFLFTQSFAKTAGNGCDWYMTACGRYGLVDNPAEYLSAVEAYITEKYKTEEKLDAKKATEWHRIALAVLAAGGNPRKIGKDSNGKRIDLIADGTYNRGYTAPLSKQGLNAYIWALITLDSKNYTIPGDAFYTRQDLIEEVVSYQNPDGGFSVIGNKADPDVTASVLICLSRYMGKSELYTVKNKKTGQIQSLSIGEVVNRAVSALSSLQLEEGGFASFGTETSESAAQVIMGLSSVGIDPQTDARFIKNGNTALNALLSFRNADGGFAHLKNGESNSMATEQALCAMVSVYRLYNNKKSFYDYTDGIVMQQAHYSGEKAQNSENTSTVINDSAVIELKNDGTNKTPDSYIEPKTQESALSSTNYGGVSDKVNLQDNPDIPDVSSSQPDDTVIENSSESEPAGQTEHPTQKAEESTALIDEADIEAYKAESTADDKSDDVLPELQILDGDNNINPIFFIIIGLALTAGGAGFAIAKRRSRKDSGEEDDFFESLKDYKEDDKAVGDDDVRQDEEKEN